MTEINEENGNASVQVTAEFPWGVENVETVRCLTEPSSLQVGNVGIQCLFRYGLFMKKKYGRSE